VKRGRKPLVIDLDEVERLAGLGLSEAQICNCIGINVGTLANRKRQSSIFSETLKRGRDRANAQVANALFTQALDGNVTAQIWWEKTRTGFTEKLTLEGNQEKPIVLAAAGAVGSPNPIAAFAPGPVGDSNLIGEGEDDSGRPPLGQNGTGRSNGIR
jgi:hypothetical protein